LREEKNRYQCIFICSLPPLTFNFISNTNNNFHILTNKPINKGNITMLTLGLKFIPTPKNSTLSNLNDELLNFRKRLGISKLFHNDINETEDDFDSTIYVPKLDTDVKKEEFIQSALKDAPITNEFITKLRKHITTESLNFTTSKQKRIRNTSKEEREQFNKLLKDENLMLGFTDKNLGPCILDKEQYHKAMIDNLSYPTYGKIKSSKAANNIRRRATERATTIISNLYQEDEEEYRFATKDRNSTTYCKMYILWKVHKKTLSTRPIIPSIGYCLNPISTYLHHELTKMLNIKDIPEILIDSNSLIRDIESKIFPPNIVMASKDVSALYPSIPIDDGIKAMERILTERQQPLDTDKIRKIDALLELLRIVMKNAIVEYNGEYYIQRIGTAMGTPVAVIFAQIFMYDLEREIVREYTDNGTLLYYKRFIDDILTLFTSEKMSKEFWSKYNKLHPAIKLTGDDNVKSTDFLDLTLSLDSNFKETGKINFTPFQKQMNTYLYLPYRSMHTEATKKGFIKGELLRYATHSAKIENYLAIRALFFHRLNIRGYPTRFLQRIFNTVKYSDRNKILYKPESSKRGKTAAVMLLQWDELARHLNLNKFFKENWPNNSEIHNTPYVSYKTGPNIKRTIQKTNGRNFK
jgi:hypothetical protein